MLGLADYRLVVFSRSELEVFEGIVDLLAQRLDQIDPLLSGGALSHQDLRLLLVVPEVRLGRQLIELFDLSFQPRNVKETPLAP